MAKMQVGTKADGSPNWHFYPTEEDLAAGRIHPFHTGGVAGTIPLSDGAKYDVTDEIIYVSEEHAHALMHHIDIINADRGILEREHLCGDPANNHTCGFEFNSDNAHPDAILPATE